MNIIMTWVRFQIENFYALRACLKKNMMHVQSIHDDIWIEMW